MPTPAPSIDPDETAKFAALAARWWDERGPMAPLHAMNPDRMAFLRAEICDQFGRAGVRPLAGLRVLDLGCGGGLVSLPLARLGADVTGLDAAADVIAVARAQAAAQGLAVRFEVGAAETFAATAPAAFDVVVALEILEHLADRGSFLAAAARLLAPGGLMILSTINRTLEARALALFAAERVLGWLEPGTHDYDKLIRPEELAAELAAADPALAIAAPIGWRLDPLTRRWRAGGGLGMNYFLLARRAKPA